MFLIQLLIGALLICLTVAIHAVALDRLINAIASWRNSARLIFKKYWKIPVLITAVLGIFCAHIIQIWIWALFYFSTITFTTVGFGDVVLGHEWRLISSFEAANGFLLFGWSAAFIFEIMSKLYEEES
jgi:Ion channel